MALLPRRAARVLLASLLALVVGGLFAPPAFAASPGELEACFLDQINAARTANGAQPLTIFPTLSQYGRAHSTEMANAGDLFHSGSAQIEPELPSGWQAWGENVGYATGSQSCDWLFEGFWESPNHRANLLNPIFDSVGIGVLVDPSDTIWTTHVFFQSPTPPATTTTTSTAPAPTTTTTPVTTTAAPTPTTSAPTPTTSSPATTTSVPPTETATPATSEVGSAGTVGTTTGPEQLSPLAPETAPSGNAGVATLTQVAGVGAPCAENCSDGERYAVFLGMVAAVGLAISWWAFRS